MDWPKLDVTERVGRATETVPTPRGSNGALAESHPPDDRMAHAQCAGSVFRNTRRPCLRLSHFLFFFARSHALSRERRSGLRTSRSSPAADLRPKRKHKKEKRTARAACMDGGGYFAPHDMYFVLFFGFVFTYAVLELERPRTALAERVIFVYPTPAQFFCCGAPCCNPAHRDGMGSGG
jgi:hypothetical protein